MIIQILPTLSYGDGVSNSALSIYKIINELGYRTLIYAENIDKKLKYKYIKKIRNLKKVDKSDIILYHLSIGSQLNNVLKNYMCKKIIIYHNITPFKYFEEYNQLAVELSYSGLCETKLLKDAADYYWADSEFNKEELISYGYKCNINVVPIPIDFNAYKINPNFSIINRYRDDDYINIIFVGRISPNKKQEDIIKTFYYFHNSINKKSRLFLVGSFNGMERYYEKLKRYIKNLKLDEVYFTGHLQFKEMISYYHLADIFLCMSEHEGFCIPLLEAMYFKVPVIAYVSSGVADTMGDAGFHIKDRDCKVAAEAINQILSNSNLKNYIIKKQNARLLDFEYEKTKDEIKKLLIKYINN